MPPPRHDRLALDRASSVRSIDQDGRLHVSLTPISKANVCPYRGSEIPEAEALGLEPDKIYMLLRDPEELAKAAPTANGIPLLSEHVPVSVDEPQKAIVAGSTGTDAVFEAPYLMQSLVVWDAEDIALIDSGEKKELSSAYRYTADMTPGTFDGVRYDGVMRDIRFNHVALVSEGRAGPDVVVGDSQIKELETMSKKALSPKALVAKGALMAHLRPKLATDAKLDFTYLARNVAANWGTKKADILTGIKSKLAADADIEDLVNLLDNLDGETDADLSLDEDGDKDGSAITPPVVKPAVDEEDDSALVEKIVAAVKAALSEGKAPPATDSDVDGKPDDKKEDKVDKTAMDAALVEHGKKVEAATIARINAIHEAKQLVKPHVGELTGAFDSASDVLKFALDAAKIDLKGVPTEAYAAMVKMLPKPGAAPASTGTVHVAMDAKDEASFAERFPDANRITSI